MRFLHTADWHVGKPLRNRNRDDEYREVLAEVLDIARQERVDCVLVAGDIYDAATPPPEAERIVYDFFRELHGAGIKAVVIAGNHDHPRRLSAVARVLEVIDVHVRGEASRPDDGGCVLIPGPGGDAAVVAALPWVPERQAVQFEEIASSETAAAYSQYAQRLANAIGLFAPHFQTDTVNILMAHVFIDSAFVGPEGGERPLHITQTYAVIPQALPATAHYVALGHLHRPQRVDTSPCPHTYYAGSLLQLDFGERGQQKEVVVFDAKPGHPAEVRHIPITKGRRLREVQGTLDELKIRAQAREFGDDFLRVRVNLAAPLPALAAHVREFLPNAVDIRGPEPGPTGHGGPTASMQGMTPLQLLERYLETQGTKLHPELKELFTKLLAEHASAEVDS